MDPREDPDTASHGEPRSFTVTCPFDETEVGRLRRSTPEQIRDAFTAAREAQRHWSQVPVEQRIEVIRRFADLVFEHQDELLDLTQRETGKARISAAEELADIGLWTHYLVRQGAAALRTMPRQGGFPLLTSTYERRVPLGVVGVITPWNYPLTLPVTDSLPALLAGNGVVLKPDEQTSHTALRLVALLREAGLPEELMAVVLGSGEEAGAAVVDEADYVMFTGSSATGRVVAQRCAQRLIGFSGELGGKNPMLVLEDADVSQAARAAVSSCFANTGQLCMSIERIYVHSSRWADFTSALLKRVRALKLGTGLEWDVDVGSLVGPAQLSRIAERVDEAVDAGAEILTGGRARPDIGPYFYEPTLLTGVTDEMRVHREETFGPVVSLYRVDDEEEAIAAANDSDYGLVASVWSRQRGDEVAQQLRTGSVNINDGHTAAWASMDAPMGGFAQSGIGRRHGREGITKYTESQTVARQRLAPVARIPGVPLRQWAQMMMMGVRALRSVR
jgi:succinate-semialdehyde dehydrogenase / glutarate-semialdehyde dehydrogenase